MIYCPKCGTANRDGSRFCNECGETLGTQTHVTCPQCGALNPAQNVFCSECRGRLVPTVASPLGNEPTAGRQDEEPSAASKPEPKDEIPAWLSELGATLSEEDKLAASEPEEDASEIPDWLRDLRDSLPTEPETETVSSLPAEEGAEPAPPATGGEEGQIPAWLAEIQSEGAEKEPIPSAGEVEGAEKLDWLAELRSSVTEEGPLPPADEAEDAETLDWLAELQAGDEEAEEKEAPVWLADLEPAATREEPSLPKDEAEEEEMPPWLAGLQLETTEEEPLPPASEAEEEETPTWLAELQLEAEEEEPLPPAGEAEEEAAPEWMAELEPAARGEEPSLPIEEAEEEETPPWLAQLRPEALEEEPLPPAEEVEEEEAPTWLADLEPEAEEEEEAPTWLAELRPEALEEEPLPPAEEAEEEEAPTWLAELQPEAEEEEAPDWRAELQPPAEEAEEQEMPTWLAELQPEAEEEELDLAPSALEPEPVSDQVPELDFAPEEEESVPPIPEGEVGDVPDWLAELEPPAIEVEAEAESPASEDMAEESTVDWLAQLLSTTPEEEFFADEEMPVEADSLDWLAPPTPSPEGPEPLARAEIPAWLMALKPAELREEGEDQDQVPAAEEPVEGTGLLTGLRGALPVEMLIAQPRATIPTEVLETPLADTPQARLFADIVGRPPEAAPKEIVSPPVHALAFIPRLIIFVALIAAVSLPLLLQEPLFPRTISAAPAIVDMYDTIEPLDSSMSVLVAFDYDPTSSGEMHVLAQALVGHVMDRGAKVVVASLLPAGPATAQSVLDSLAAERPAYADGYGQRYANLGYLPGQAAAVRLMGLSLQSAFPRDFQGTQLSDLPVMKDLDSIQAFDLVVELAATQETLRWWIEQARMPYDIPLGAGVSASIDPFARPYYETVSQQLVGMVSGVPGAATYNALRSGRDSPEGDLAARLDSQLVGHLVFILVLLVGNGVYLAQRGSGREA